MKTIFIFILLTLNAFGCPAQGKQGGKSFICNNGAIHFFASTHMADIEATSSNAVCVMNTQTQKISARVKMTTFEFKRKKMQADFNKSYAESDKFPYATMEAKVVSKIDLSKDGTYDVTLRGTFEIHGVKKEREINGKLTIKDAQPVSATAGFEIILADYNIKAPTLIVKLANAVMVDVSFVFVKTSL